MPQKTGEFVLKQLEEETDQLSATELLSIFCASFLTFYDRHVLCFIQLTRFVPPLTRGCAKTKRLASGNTACNA